MDPRSTEASETTDTDDPDPAASAQSFYTRWAGVYDLLARYAPRVGTLRQRAVEAVELDRGDVVLDLGCGTGANLPYLREAVGSHGRVVGVDFAPGPVAIARDRATDWENVHVLRGDVTQLPVRARERTSAAPERHTPAAAADQCTPDAILASFVIGMVPDPATAVRSWATLVGAGGRLGLLDLSRTTDPPWRWLNPLFDVLTRASAPDSDAGLNSDATDVLDHRVSQAHETLADCCVDVDTSTHVGGFARLSAGRVTGETDGGHEPRSVRVAE